MPHILNRLAAALVAAGLAAPVIAFAQSAAGLEERRASVVAAPAASALARSAGTRLATVQAYLRARGAADATLASLRERGSSASPHGATHLRLGQEVAGLEVVGRDAKAAFNARGELVQWIDRLGPVSGTPAAARIGEAQALAAALARVHPDLAAPGGGARSGNVTTFARTSDFHSPPTVTRVVVPLSDGSLATGFRVETWTEAKNQLHETLVSGDGRVLAVEKRTANDAYNVFVVSPLVGPQAVVNGPAPLAGAPSPAGWLETTASQLGTQITGNNVKAYLDVDSNNRPDRGGSAVTDARFVTAADLTVSPTSAANRAVATQNLFFLNNVVHDKLYTLGFNEGAGNFQSSNFGKGGAEKDPVLAEAQDGGGTDNANFATPRDGRSPRMQMYLWTGAGATHNVHVNGPVAADYGAKGAEFGPAFTVAGITGALVAAEDAGGTSALDACEAITTPLAGKVALVNRGNCDFTVKVMNAQTAGATAVVVANNQPVEPVTMGGTNRRIRIPALMVSQADGAALRATADANVTLSRLAVQPLQRDASLDSDIVYHEYGHGLTWRMIGGMSGPMAGAIGEGASDGVAMLINGDDKVAEYSGSHPNGIRRFPYAGYPLTYANVNGAEVHDDGEIYAAIVWRMVELYAGQGLSRDTLFRTFVDGMNYTPSTPAFEDMRNGMLASAEAQAQPAQCTLIWQAFAQFGVGVGAQGVVNADGTITVTPSNVARGDCTRP